jgi:uncharacterized protein YjbJ (UPF0337 family)
VEVCALSALCAIRVGFAGFCVVLWVGKTKEVIGRAFGDKKLEAEGKVDQAKGAAHNAAGDVKDAAREAGDRLNRATDKY